MDSNARSIAKAVTYRMLGSASTAGILFVLTNRVSLSLIGGALDVGLKIGVYFIHERIWNHIQYGRDKPPEYEI